MKTKSKNYSMNDGDEVKYMLMTEKMDTMKEMMKEIW